MGLAMKGEKEKFLGSSKVSTNLRVSLVLDAAKLLNVEIGDHVLFYADDKGQVMIRKA